jgi:IPT/TIG domain
MGGPRIGIDTRICEATGPNERGGRPLTEALTVSEGSKRFGLRTLLRATVVVVALFGNVAVAHAEAPEPSEVAPPIGEIAGGTPVVITGRNLLPPGAPEPCSEGCAGLVTVRFGTAEATVESGTSTELHVITPSGAPEITVGVTVETRGGAGGERELPHAFSYVHPPPVLGITSPSPGAVTTSSYVLVTGEASTNPWDQPKVNVALYQGASEGAPIETHSMKLFGGQWATSFGALGPGTYTVRANQIGEKESVGWSQPVTFTVLAGKAGSGGSGGTDPPPVASFGWFPPSPNAGEPVSLFSSSKDAVSPITTFGWAFASTGPFQSAGPIYTIVFANPGAHLVRLRVGSADGQSSTASETIMVGSPVASLMQPFPIVRIAGTDTSRGVKISLLSVFAPSGVEISVHCKGGGCPLRKARRAAPSTKRGTATVRFRRFERALPAGVKLVVRVAKLGEIGKYTRFVIRKGKLPKRIDTCLEPAGVKPQACPS